MTRFGRDATGANLEQQEPSEDLQGDCAGSLLLFLYPATARFYVFITHQFLCLLSVYPGAELMTCSGDCKGGDVSVWQDLWD